MSENQETLLIVGASARAAAQSAIRAGYKVAAVDLFADVDLQAICPTWRVNDYPQGLIAAAAQAPPGPWLYTGGLENHPEVVAAISEQRELLGNAADVLRVCRDPFAFRLECFVCSLGFVSWCEIPGEVPDEGKWMLKPRASAGGQGMKLYEKGPYPVAPPTHFWEEFKEGHTQSAVYVADERGWCLLGVTEQLTGAEWTGARGFQYAGSIGPLTLATDVVDEYEIIGLNLRIAFGLRGLFGVDTVLSPEGELFPIELNPRYTASIEILERSLGFDAIGAHVRACRGGDLPPREYDGTSCERSCGKAILYAREAVEISDDFARWCLEINAGREWPMLADLPATGTKIEQGQPILTIFAEGKCTASARFALRKLADEVFARL